MAEAVLHFSHDPTITEFRPHRAVTADVETPYVWAIDAEHAPAYWFPRDCPRVTFWLPAPADPDGPADERAGALLGGASRVHAVEWTWFGRLRDAVLYRYAFDPAPFHRIDEEAGYWVARQPVRPLGVEPVGDLLAAHERAGIELRLVPDLRPLAEAVVASGLPFSLIRMRGHRPS